ncbi:hypothetical protein BBBOND_0312090 [Babesia bigemina]|uniref:Uncharacterized protein n=1 Tax=Babesia bigemina TaxID=5866 RepID=A0A061D9G7_BABBI|nr:hypothetical protein BBBOND_0312090 [Babesia bigemina]CDR97306.1 hypothetical protein BBBOND_0312090 [Babesia bigemina]|eukprot:XP_012769492.1 hypothetical protein BBBOND_0312090 [Babesia bigemina]
MEELSVARIKVANLIINVNVVIVHVKINVQSTFASAVPGVVKNTLSANIAKTTEKNVEGLIQVIRVVKIGLPVGVMGV